MKIYPSRKKIWELQQRKAQTSADVLGEQGCASKLSPKGLEHLLAEECSSTSAVVFFKVEDIALRCPMGRLTEPSPYSTHYRSPSNSL